MKTLLVDVQNFKYIRDNGMYYVDKSMFIAQILDSNEHVKTLERHRLCPKRIRTWIL